MSDLRGIVVGLIAILFIATASVTIFSNALTNNVASGGDGTTVPFPLQNQTTAFNSKMTTYSSQLANQTLDVSTQPDAANAFAGLLATSQAASTAISLAFDASGILFTLVASAGVSLVPLGVPAILFAFGALMVGVIVTFAILAAVFKWNI